MTTEDEFKRYCTRFSREYEWAREEFLRLSQLFNDVCWYNFETECNTWKGPWRYSDPQSKARLDGMSFTQHWSRGRLIECGEFPVWFEGPICEAPRLPPEIIFNDLMDAGLYMRACEEQMTAPIDWAPGGNKYLKLKRTTLVGKRARDDFPVG